MAVAWVVGQYVRDDNAGHGQCSRFFIQADFFQQLAANGATFTQPVEVLGNYGVCKIRAAQAVLDAVDALPNTDIVPKDRLDDPLSDFTPAQQQRMRDIALAMGYTLQEINARFPNPIGTYTLGDVFRFFSKRWRAPFFNGVDILFETIDRHPPCTVDGVGADQVLVT